MCNTKLSKEFITGFFESDGGFIIIFKKDKRSYANYRMQLQMKITQKQDEVLYLIKDWLLSHGIKSIIYPSRGMVAKGTPYLLVEGFKSCNKFMHHLCFKSLSGVKLYSYYLFKAVLNLIKNKKHNTSFGRKKIIDIKYNLHTLPPAEPFLRIKGQMLQASWGNFVREKLLTTLEKRIFSLGSLSTEPNLRPERGLSRKDWEIRHNFELGSSLFQGEKIIFNCGLAYFARLLRCLSYPEQEKLVGDYVSGLLAGDGCLTFTIGGKDRKDGQKYPIFTLTAEKGSELVLWRVAHYFQDRQPRFYSGKGCFYYRGQRREIVQKLYNHFKKHKIVVIKKNYEKLMSYLSPREKVPNFLGKG